MYDLARNAGLDDRDARLRALCALGSRHLDRLVVDDSVNENLDLFLNVMVINVTYGDLLSLLGGLILIYTEVGDCG